MPNVRRALPLACLALLGCPAAPVPPVPTPSTPPSSAATSASPTVPPSGGVGAFSVEPRTVCVGGTVTVRINDLKARRVTCWLYAARPPLPAAGEGDEPYAVKVGEQLTGAASATFAIKTAAAMGPLTTTGGTLLLVPGRSYSVKVTMDEPPSSAETGFTVAATCPAADPAPVPGFEVTPVSPCLGGPLRVQGRGFAGKRAVLVLEGKNTSERFLGFHPYMQAATVDLGPDGAIDYTWTVPSRPAERIASFFSPDQLLPDATYRMAVYDQDGSRYVPQAGEFRFRACTP